MLHSLFGFWDSVFLIYISVVFEGLWVEETKRIIRILFNEILARINNLRSFSGMTTELQPLINPLKRSAHNFFAANPNLFGYLHIVEPLMDRILDSHLESMRKTMQMQEDIFKQQVQELHRIYNLQKKLMQEFQIGSKRQNQPITTHETETGNHGDFQIFVARDDPKEASGSCSGESSRKIPINFDLERPTESAPSNIQRNNDDDDVEVELTLSIGSQYSTNRHKRSKSQPSKGDEHGESSSDMSRSSSFYQENTRPHWLMQDLSLNRT